jgi:tripartite-type tricarboxylate transporter receptor subunit TctC
MAPAGIPAEIPARISPLLNKYSDMPDIRERMLAMGLVPTKDTPAGLDAELRKQHANFAALVKKYNIKAE